MKDKWVRLSVVIFTGLVCLTARCDGVFYVPPECPPSGMEVYPNDNCGLYYVCDNGMLKVLACPFGQNFDRVLERCRALVLVDCNLQPPTTTPTIKTTSPPTTTPTTTESTTQPPNQTTTTPKPTPKPICPSTGDVIIPTGDCVSYYNCTNGSYVIDTCPPGNLLDPKTLTCGSFSAISCYPVMPATTSSKPSTTTEAVTAPPVLCPPYGTEIVPTGDCYTYYNCTDGDYDVESCPSGTLMDSETISCMPFNQVTCSPSTPTAAATFRPTPPAPFDCPSSGNQNFSTGDCVTYYQCSNGTYSVQTCPSAYLYDSDINKCMPFYEVTCSPLTTTTVQTTVTTTKAPTTTTKAPTTTTTTTQAPTTQAPTTPAYSCPSSGHAAYPVGDCSSYYDCEDGTWSIQKCSLFTNFDPTQGTCMPNLLSPCVAASVTEPPPAASHQSASVNRRQLPLCPHSGQFFYPGRDCKSYNYCSEGSLKIRSCPPGSSFDQLSQTCLPSQLVQCSTVS